MPKLASVAGVELRLNGMGALKKAIFFKAYVVGLYLENLTSDAQIAITTEEPKRIVISMLRDVSREMFVQAVEMGVMRNAGPQMPRLRTRLDRLEQALPALKKGEVLDMTYLRHAGARRGPDDDYSGQGLFLLCFRHGWVQSRSVPPSSTSCWAVSCALRKSLTSRTWIVAATL
jgi:hypothetical protein